jgi:hypothetical protein
MATSVSTPRPRQRPPASGRALPSPLPPFLQEYLRAGDAAVAEPFRGITADGQVEPGLYPIQATGVSTRPIQDAAEAFLASLDATRRNQAVFSIDSDAWRRWSNIHVYTMRHGVSLEDLDAAQRERALALLRESLSAEGHATARDVMRLNETIAEITGRTDEYGEWLYWVSLFGTPSATEPWGWQIDGHHLIVNCFVLGSQVVMTPMFMGSEPTVADAGIYAGTRVFDAEEREGLALMRSLTTEQRGRAILSESLPSEVFTTAFRDNFELRYEGIRFDELRGGQRDQMLRLIETYTGRIRPGHDAVKLAEVQQHFGDTYFAWMGGCDEDSVFYYRIHSPVVLIEFDHQRGIALDNDQPSRNHIHTVVRTPNGNDYGKDLLRQHHERFDHTRATAAPR